MSYYFKFFLTFIFFLAFNLFLNAQLTEKFEKIEGKINSEINNPPKMWELIYQYIQDTKKNNNEEGLLNAYKIASVYAEHPKNFKYADSALNIAKKSQNAKLLTIAYLNRGIIYMDESKHQKALDDILIANQYSIKIDDEYFNNKTKYYMAQNKIYLGLYEEANLELNSCMIFFKDNLNNSNYGKDYQQFYIYSMMSYIDTNTRIGKQIENTKLIKEIIYYLKKNKLDNYIPYFISSEGTDAYYSGNYHLAITKLSQALRLYNDYWPHFVEVFYLGMSNWKLGKKEVAVKYFEEIDKDYNETQKLDPQFRTAYELLIKYNDSIGNRDKQLDYINKLMKLDRSYEKNYKYLYTKINKEYDTKKLILEKNEIESSLKTQRTIISTILLLTILATLFFWNRYNSLQKKYKEKFEEIISIKHKKVNEVNKELASEIEDKKSSISFFKPENSFDLEFYNKIPGLNPLIVENILNKLEHFEKENKFLDNQVSKTLLSEILNTNPTYLSRIINVYKGKNVSIYINDLRLEYIIDLMKNDAKYLNMDVKELALLSGFTNTQNFSDNFQRKFEIKPSYFIKMMKENIKTSSL
ncbi:helix-turn-helix transcriptional regulator [Cloacibacterium normanense]